MFGWFRRKKKQDPLNINIHITGSLKIQHESGSGYSPGTIQGPKHTPTTSEDNVGSAGVDKRAEADVESGLFTDIQTPEVEFGEDIELSSPEDKDKD
jgi:hypothetical protein